MLPSAASPNPSKTRWLISRNHSPRASTAPKSNASRAHNAGRRPTALPQATIRHTGAPSKFIFAYRGDGARRAASWRLEPFALAQDVSAAPHDGGEEQ